MPRSTQSATIQNPIVALRLTQRSPSARAQSSTVSHVIPAAEWPVHERYVDAIDVQSLREADDGVLVIAHP